MSHEITIITTTYNRSFFLKRMIQSVLNQRFRDWVLLIVDDGSTDETETLVKQYKDPRIHYIHKNHSGTAESRNKGISLAQTDYITFLDSDDEACVNWLSTIFNHLDENTGMLSCGYFRIDNKSNKKAILPLEIGVIWSGIKIGYKSGTLIFKKKVLESIGGFDTKLNSGLNTDLILRIIPFLIKTKLNIKNINNILLKVYEHSGIRIRNNPEMVYKGTVYLLEKHKLWFQQNPNEYENYSQVAAINLARLGRFKEGRKILETSLKTKLRFKKALRYLLMTIPRLRNKIWQ